MINRVLFSQTFNYQSNNITTTTAEVPSGKESSAITEGCLALMQSGTVAESRIKLRCGDVLVVDSARGAMQLAALRRFLAEGFQVHLQHNTLLHQVFVLLYSKS